MNPRDHHVAGQPPAWSRRAASFRHLDGTLADRYLRDEEREDDARMAADWRKAHPGALRRSWIMQRAVRRERRAFRQSGRWQRFLAFGNKLIDSWWVLLPLGGMCVWAVLYRAGVFGP
jgi:hypothetical protein